MKLFNFRKKTPPPAPYPYFAVVTLHEHVLPLDRGDRYEDPLAARLERENLGEVSGGGNSVDQARGEVVYANIDLELANLDEAVNVVIQSLEEAGAPAGSEIAFEKDGIEQKVEFGRLERVIIYLDGVNLPDDVYASSPIEGLAAEVEASLCKQSAGEIRNSWAGPSETAIAIYGREAEAIFAAIDSVLRTYPLCQNGRVVINAGLTTAREVKLPRWPPSNSL